jgi:HEAT repeat protein
LVSITERFVLLLHRENPRKRKDTNPDVRISAAASMSKLGDVRGQEALISEIQPLKMDDSASPAEELRRMARDAARARAALKLGMTETAESAEALRAALADASGVVRDAAAIALAKLGQGASTQFTEALKDSDESVRASAARSLGLIGRDGLDGLKKALSSDVSVSVRAEAATALGSFSDGASLALLITALSDKSGRVRLSATRALARRGEPNSTVALKKLLDQSPSPEISLIAMSALSSRGEDVDITLAELTLGQKDPELKQLAVNLLSNSHRPQSQELLVRTMRDESAPRASALAAQALVALMRKAATTQ